MGHKHTINSTLQLSMVVINGDVLRFNKILTLASLKQAQRKVVMCCLSLLLFVHLPFWFSSLSPF